MMLLLIYVIGFVNLFSNIVPQSFQVEGKPTKSAQRGHIRSVILNKKHYNKENRPSEEHQTNVTVYMKVLAINSVSVTKMEYSTDVYLRQEWIDGRLAWINIDRFKSYNFSIASPSLKQDLWLPDLFFRNGKEGYVHKMTQPNYLMRLSPNGAILYSQKITMKFSCQMNLQTFPMDNQICLMDIGSYGYTLDQLRFTWRKTEPMVITRGLQISEFDSLKTVRTIDCNNNTQTSTGVYTCLKVHFHLERQLGSYIVSTFIPSILIVMVSWLNFWINIDAVPARITLGLVTLLGIITQAIGISSTLPRVSYIKAIDIWIIGCIIFVICALLEFAVANTVLVKENSNNWENDVKDIVQNELMNWCTAFDRLQIRQMQHNNSLDRDRLQFCHDLETLLIEKAIESHKKLIKLSPSNNSSIDSYSQFLFPASFLFYSGFYWLYYLKLVKYSHEA